MTKLLVSVRDVAELKLAIEAGVDIIDIKEPKARITRLLWINKH